MNNMESKKLPRIGNFVLNLLLPDYDYRYIIGIYEREYLDLKKSRGKLLALGWFWIQVIKSSPPLVKMKTFWSMSMFRNYFKIAVRNIFKNKLNSFLNFSGLSLGIACSLLLIFHVKDELSYEKHLPKVDRICRIAIETWYGDDYKFWATVPVPIGPALEENIPEIAANARFRYARTQILGYFSKEGEPKSFEEKGGYYADPSAIDIFDLHFVKGDPSSALDEPLKIIITESMAEKYFGNEEPISKTLRINNSRNFFTVTGVIEDNNFNTHLKFDYLISFSSFIQALRGNEILLNSHSWKSLYTYILINKNTTVEEAESKIDVFMEDFYSSYGPLEEIKKQTQVHFQPIADIHLHSNLEQESGPNSNIAYVYIFSITAFFLLLIACVNFVNISTAQAIKRIKEVGVRKVIGAYRRQLVKQFLTESLLIAFASTVIAVIIFKIVLPYYNSLSGKDLVFLDLLTIGNSLVLLSMIVLIGFTAGLYPSLFMAGFNPVNAIKGVKSPGSSVNTLRKGLVIFQFAISIFLIFSTLIIYNQMEFFQKKDLGFDKDRLLAFNLYGNLEDQYLRNRQAFKSELLKYAGISDVTTSSKLIGDRFSVEFLIIDGTQDDEQVPSARFLRVDEDFIETMGIQLVEGRSFKNRSLEARSYILNEAAVKTYNLEKPLGQKANNTMGGNTGEIIGVVKDFHFASLHNKIEPLILDLQPYGGGRVIVRIRGGSISETLEFLKNKIDEIAPGHLFIYTFIDDKLSQLYLSEDRISSIFKAFSFIAIFISCLGLFGLSAYSAELRIKEIGVRKVLGSTLPGIIKLLSMEFVIWVLIANIVALPIAWYIMNKWLQNFAYKINIGIDSFITSALIALVLALLTVSYKSIKTALGDPVKSLRYE
ncbi:MAG: FtsX-like permease family protein [bacterium]|nr:FtsX-like permease family protein [bacterium]